MKILVINAGSSSIKFRLFEMPEARVLARGIVEPIGSPGAHLSQTAGDRRHDVAVDVADHHAGMQLILDVLAGR